MEAQSQESMDIDSSRQQKIKAFQNPPQWEFLLGTSGFASIWTNFGLYRGFDNIFDLGTPDKNHIIPSGELGAFVQFNPDLGSRLNNFVFIRSGFAFYRAIGHYYIIPGPCPSNAWGLNYICGTVKYRRTNNLAIPLYTGIQFNIRNTRAFAYVGVEIITPPRWLGNTNEDQIRYNICKTCPLRSRKTIHNLNLKAAIGFQPDIDFIHSGSIFIEQTRWKTHILNIGMSLNFRMFSHE